MSATIKDFLECFKTSIKTRKLSRVWPWNLAVVAFCCHLPLQYKWSSLSVQTAEMCFYMLHQKPQVSTALSWPKISAVCFPSLTALPNASSVNQHTRHKSIFSGLHFHIFFFFLSEAELLSAAPQKLLQVSRQMLMWPILSSLPWRGIQQVIWRHCGLDPTERAHNYPSALADSYRRDWDLQQACNHELIAYSRIYFSCCASGSKIHGLRKETFSCSS